MGLNNGTAAHPFDSSGAPSERVVRIVAWLEGVEPTALSPLQGVVDADALDRLFDAERRDDVEVAFEFEGYDVRIERCGSITVGGVDHPVGGALPRGTNALLLAPADSDCGEEACNDLLNVRSREERIRELRETAPREWTPPEEMNVLGVTVDSSETDPLDRWRFEPGTPRRTGLIAVGGFTRSAAASNGGTNVRKNGGTNARRSGGAASPPGGVQVDGVPDPSDLQALGMRVNERLSSWDAPDAKSVVCFHSLSDLLEVVETERLFRFLHLLNGWLSSKDVVAHFHLDPSEHDERTINTLQPLFDVTFEVEATDGGTCSLHVP